MQSAGRHASYCHLQKLPVSFFNALRRLSRIVRQRFIPQMCIKLEPKKIRFLDKINLLPGINILNIFLTKKGYSISGLYCSIQSHRSALQSPRLPVAVRCLLTQHFLVAGVRNRILCQKSLCTRSFDLQETLLAPKWQPHLLCLFPTTL